MCDGEAPHTGALEVASLKPSVRKTYTYQFYADEGADEGLAEGSEGDCGDGGGAQEEHKQASRGLSPFVKWIVSTKSDKVCFIVTFLCVETVQISSYRSESKLIFFIPCGELPYQR